MKVKLNVSLPAAAVMLFILSMTGYASPGHSHSHEASGNIALENPDRVTLGDKAKFGPEVTGNIAVENTLPTSETGSTKGSMVSEWLEARATEEVIVREAGRSKSSPAKTKFIVQDEGMVMGGGWCNHCGCWMRHGCDSNGTCDNGHRTLCGLWGLGCELHDGNCISSG